MIENKRFIPVYECVTQDNEVYVVCKGEHNADVVVTALNEFYERNEYLKKENEQLKQENKSLHKEIEELKKENEQLKRFITSMGFTIEKEKWNYYQSNKGD